MLGETISHYKILEKLGQGGMGEVYLAEDTRLGRNVALKFLAPELARDRESLVRFRNEARAAAELSHPNIATIHDFDEVDGKSFLVLEYLEGQTLRDRTTQGPLPIEDVLRIGKALAAGLAKAHSHGIVHRDIKSTNVMVTKKDEVKILDFGLAHLADATQLTRPGTTLGTIGYMSPEQARGEAADERSDVWSLGIVLYECLTGRLPFLGEQASVLGQIQAAKPTPPTGVRSGIPLPLESVVLRCLEKDPTLRCQHADEVLSALRFIERRAVTGGDTPKPSGKSQVLDDIGVTGTSTEISRRRHPRVAWLAATIAGLLVVIIGIVLAQRWRRPTTPLQPFVAHRLTWEEDLEVDPAISPDRRKLAYSAGAPGSLRIFIRQLSGGTPLKLTHDPDGDHRWPRWSPDGERILFTVSREVLVRHADTQEAAFGRRREEGSVYVIPSLGGMPKRLPGVPAGTSVHAADWSADGSKIVFATRDSMYVHERSSERTRGLLSAGPPIQGVGAFSWSPNDRFIALDGGNRGFLFSASWHLNAASSQLWAVPSAGGSPVRLLDDGHQNYGPRWSSDGRYVYFVSNRGGIRDVYRLPFDTSGSGNLERLTTGMSPLSIDTPSQDGSLALSRISITANVWAVDLNDSVESPSKLHQITQGEHGVEGMDILADGRWLVFDSNLHGNHDIYLMDMEGGVTRRLTSDDAEEFYPQLSPKRDWVAFYSIQGGVRRLMVVRPDGTGLRQVSDGPYYVQPMDWTPGGDALLVFSNRGDDGRQLPAGRGHLFLIPNWVNGVPSTEWRPVCELEGAIGCQADISPDRESIIMSRPQKTGNWQPVLTRIVISSGDQHHIDLTEHGIVRAGGPRWSGDGKEIVFPGMDQGGFGIWAIRPDGSGLRTVARVDDRRLQMQRPETACDGSRFYFGLRELEADVWMLTRGESGS